MNPIQKYRRAKGLTQELLAQKAELSVRTVQRAEAGSVTPSTETLEAIAEVLEVSADKLSTVYDLPSPVKAALRKIHEGMVELGAFMYENPGEIDKFGHSHGTYVFQPRDLPPEIQPMITGETLPFHHAHLLESHEVRKEMGKNPDGSDDPWIRRLCVGPTISAVINVSPWRSSVWKATGSFTLVNEGWLQMKHCQGYSFETIEVHEGDRIEIVAGDRGYSTYTDEMYTGTRFIRTDHGDVWAEFDHTKLPVVPVLDHERTEYRVPRGLSE